MSAGPRKRKSNQGIGICHNGSLMMLAPLIQAAKLGPPIMRYEFGDYEWADAFQKIQ
jgi:hypothetical protein